jgi:hypothetical protein
MDERLSRGVVGKVAGAPPMALILPDVFVADSYARAGSAVSGFEIARLTSRRACRVSRAHGHHGPVLPSCGTADARYGTRVLGSHVDARRGARRPAASGQAGERWARRLGMTDRNLAGRRIAVSAAYGLERIALTVPEAELRFAGAATRMYQTNDLGYERSGTYVDQDA